MRSLNRNSNRLTLTKSKGFTLVELLIVISIQGILAAVLFMVINPINIMEKGRDSRRISDMETLRNAILLALTDEEIVLIDTDFCTADCNSTDGTTAVDGTGYVRYTLPSGKIGLGKFLAALPLDPVNDRNFYYSFASDATYFEINATLESDENVEKMTSDGGDDATKYELGTNLTVI